MPHELAPQRVGDVVRMSVQRLRASRLAPAPRDGMQQRRAVHGELHQQPNGGVASAQQPERRGEGVAGQRLVPHAPHLVPKVHEDVEPAHPQPERREDGRGDARGAQLQQPRAQSRGDGGAVASKVDAPLAVGQGDGGQDRVQHNPPSEQRPVDSRPQLAVARRCDPAELVQRPVAVVERREGAAERRAEPDPSVEGAHPVGGAREGARDGEVEVEGEASVPAERAEE
mmetsp:Transcript_21399/g.69040  ORF Transcript_21399/g.69040 Transcript_21399/m.69040 type:complete len:228 (+) Transcript_21399:1973-2656(+)